MNPWPVIGYFAALAASAIAPSLVRLAWPSPGVVMLFLTFGAIAALLPFGLTRLVLWRFGLSGLIVEVLAGVVICAVAWVLLGLLFGQKVGFLRDYWASLVMMGKVAGAVYWSVGWLGRKLSGTNAREAP